MWKRTQWWVASGLLCAAFAAGCGRKSDDATETKRSALTNAVLVTLETADRKPHTKKGVKVWLFDGDKNLGSAYAGFTDAYGVATMHVPAGSYRFAYSDGSQNHMSGPGNHCTPPACSTATIAMPAIVRINVVDKNGTSLPGRFVHLYDGDTPGSTLGSGDVPVPRGNWRFGSSDGSRTHYSHTSNGCTVPGCTSVTLYMTTAHESDFLTARSGVVSAGAVDAYWRYAAAQTGDWIGVFKVGTADDVLVGSVPINGATLHASPVSLNAGTPDGEYELRLFLNGGARGPLTGNKFKISNQIRADGPAMPGAELAVSWGVAGATAADCVGLYGLDGTLVGSRVTTPGNSLGGASITVPPVTGAHDVRYFHQCGTPAERLLATSGKFNVGVTLTAVQSAVRRGALLRANWTGVRVPSFKDWIGLFPAGGSSRSPLAHTSALSADDGSGTAAIEMPVDLPEGSYELRLFSGAGYEVTAARTGITVSVAIAQDRVGSLTSCTDDAQCPVNARCEGGICEGRPAGVWVPKPDVGAPMGMIQPTGYFDPHLGAPVVFGGYGGPNFEIHVNDVFKYNPTTGWALIPLVETTDLEKPPGGCCAGIAFDTEQQVAWLHGFPATGYSDLWKFDGRNVGPGQWPWTKVPRTADWVAPGSSGEMLAYDSTRKVLVFPAAYDTWIMDQLVFERNTAGTWMGFPTVLFRPEWRMNSAVAYDAARGQTVMAGGFGKTDVSVPPWGASIPMHDTWTWNLGKWTPKNPAHRPVETMRGGATYDSHRKRTIVHDQMGKVREWDGEDWHATTTTPLIGSYGAVLSYDPTRKRTVMYAYNTTGEYYTNGNSCDPSRPGAEQCGSGNCVDGVCCAQSTCGNGQVCNSAAAPGTCTASECGNCDDGDPCTADTCNLQAGTCRHDPVASTQLDPSPACALRLTEVCRVLEGGVNNIVFGYENISTLATVSVPVGEANTFYDPPDRGQPRLFTPGKHAFKVPLESSSATWRLATSEKVGGMDTPECQMRTSGDVREVVLADGAYPLGFDAYRIRQRPLESTTTSPALDGSGAQYAAGALAANFSVSHDGAATYDIPIRLPAGRGGFMPRQFGLVYNSNAGNGTAGMGFQLTGPSQIQRCSNHPTFGDAAVAPIDWAGSTFCLDGKRLVADGANQFRLEDDPAPRITVMSRNEEGVPDGFKVEDGAGNILYYGSRADARLEGKVLVHHAYSALEIAVPEADWSAGPKRFAWSLAEIEDRFGQKAQFTYDNRTTADGQEGKSQDFTGMTYDVYRLSIEYEARPDANERYVRGMRLVSDRRIKAIRVYFVAGERLLTEYRLAYEEGPMTKRSRLKAVRECDGGGVCRAPTAFEWQDPDPTYRAVDSGLRLDTEFFNGGRNMVVQVVDLDDDGRDDLLMRRQGNGTKDRFWEYRLSNGMRFAAPVRTTGLPSGIYREENDYTLVGPFPADGPLGFSISVPSWLATPSSEQKWTVYSDALITDLDANGSPEIGLWDTTLKGYRFHRWMGAAAFQPIPFNLNRIMPYIADLNGDALPELIRKDLTAKRWKVLGNSTSQPGVFTEELAIDPELVPGLTSSFITETNGDGQYELLVRRKQTFTYSALNTSGAPLKAVPLVESFLATNGGDDRIWFFDANGDGLPDVIRAEARVAAGSRDRPLTEGHGVKPTFFQNTGAGFRVSKRTASSPRDFGLVWGEYPEGTATDPTFHLIGESTVQDYQWARTDKLHSVDNGLRTADLDGDGRQEILLLGERFGCSDFDHACFRPTLRPRPPVVIKLGYDGKWQTSYLPPALHAPVMNSISGGKNWYINRIWGHKLTRIADVDGDGIPEIIAPRWLGTRTGTRPNDIPDIALEIWKRESKKADLLGSVKDGLGAATRITYAPMSDRQVFTPAQNCSYPLNCPRRGRWLVKNVEHSTGLAAPALRSETHAYEGARSDLGGRDWLGFAKHTVTNVASGSTTAYEFDNVTRAGRFYPFAGLVRAVKTTHSVSEGRIVRVETNTDYANLAAGNPSHRLLVRPTSRCEKRYDYKPVTGDATYLPFSVVCTTYERYDEFGHVGLTTRSGSMETLVREATYEHRKDVSPRLLGILTESRETSTINGDTETRTTRWVPDVHGLPESQTIEPEAAVDQPPLKLVTEFIRDDVGLVIESVTTGDQAAPRPGTSTWTPEMRSRWTRTDYDEFGYPRFVMNAEGHQEEFVHEPGFGLLVAKRDANGVASTMSYDGFGRLVASRPQGSAEVFTSYSAMSGQPFVTTTVQKRGTQTLETVTVAHDVLGRPVRTTTSAPRSKTRHSWTRHDVLGRVSGVSAPQFTLDETTAKFTTMEYDALDRLTKRTDGDGVVSTRASYREAVSTATNALEKKQIIARDTFGAVLASETRDEKDAVHASLAFTYGAFGVLTKTKRMLTGSAVEMTSDHDRLGRPLWTLDPDRGKTTFVYNAFGDVVYRTDADGSLETRTYDLLGRQQQVNDADGTTSFVYDGAAGGIGAVSRAESASGITSERTFDEFARPRGEHLTVPGAGKFTYERWYDAAGRVAGMRYPAVLGQQFQVTYDYSTSSGTTPWRVRDDQGRTLWQAEDFSPFGVPKHEVFGNSLRVVRDVDDATGLLRGIRAGFVDNPFHDEGSTTQPPGLPEHVERIQDLFFDYDAARNILVRKDRGRNDPESPALAVDETFDYDSLNRLKTWSISAGPSATAFSYTFDSFGNLEGRTATGDGVPWSFKYTHATRRHAITTSTIGNVSKTYDYDGRGRRYKDGDRLISFTAFDLPKKIERNGVVISTFEYDASGIRVRKVSNGTETITVGGVYERVSPGPLGGILHRFHVTGPGRVIAEVEWTQGGGLLEKSGGTKYLHDDRQGSIEVVTGGTSGEVLGRQRFEPYGNQVEPGNPALAVSSGVVGGLRRGFTGHEHDDELGLVDMKGRIYDPSSAAFLSPDPVVSVPYLAHTYHPYSYVSHNPSNFTDPTGYSHPEPPWEMDPGSDSDGSDTSSEGDSGEAGLAAQDTEAAARQELEQNGFGEAGSGRSGYVLPQSLVSDETGSSSQRAPSQNTKSKKKAAKKASGAKAPLKPFTPTDAEDLDYYAKLAEYQLHPGKGRTPEKSADPGLAYTAAAIAAAPFVSTWELGRAIGRGDWKVAGKMAALSLAPLAAFKIVQQVKRAGAAVEIAKTSNAARREVMRQQGIPTSLQPASQSRNASGRSYEYEVPRPGGGTELKSVQQQTLDRSHPGQSHWEAGTVKTDPVSGAIRNNEYGRPKLTNDKSRMGY